MFLQVTSDLRLNRFEPVLTGYLWSCHNRQPVAVAVRRNLAEKPDRTGLPDTTNDVKCVVWAIRKLFYYSFHVILLLLTMVFRYYFIWEGLVKAVTMKTGPNTSFGPLVSFFIFISCFVSNDCIQVLFIYRKAYETMKTGPFISIFSYLRPPVCFFFPFYFSLFILY